MDMAFHGDELFVACQGDGSVHVIDIPNETPQDEFSGRHRLRVRSDFSDLRGANYSLGDDGGPGTLRTSQLRT